MYIYIYISVSLVARSVVCVQKQSSEVNLLKNFSKFIRKHLAMKVAST